MFYEAQEDQYHKEQNFLEVEALLNNIVLNEEEYNLLKKNNLHEVNNYYPVFNGKVLTYINLDHE